MSSGPCVLTYMHRCLQASTSFRSGGLTHCLVLQPRHSCKYADSFGWALLYRLLFTPSAQVLRPLPEAIQQLSIASGIEIDAACPALVLPDHTTFTPAQQRAAGAFGPCICFEIKPKFGCMPDSSCIPRHQDIKRRVPRFLLHQMLKYAKGKVPHMSRYNPLNLFSGEPSRVSQALHALVDAPSNNLKVFVDGMLAYGGQPSANSTLNAALISSGGAVCGRDALAAVLQCFFPSGRAPDVTLLIALLQEVLQREGVLQRLLQLQQQDEHDIAGVIHLYRRVLATHAEASAAAPISTPRVPPNAVPGARADVEYHDAQQMQHSAPGSVSLNPSTHSANPPAALLCCCTERTEQTAAVGALAVTSPCKACEAVDQLMRLPQSKALEVLRRYLTAATAKDCGIMVTLQQVLVVLGGLGAGWF